MNVLEFSVNLDTNRQVFYPGERITGYVVVDLQGQLQTRGIKIEFDGNERSEYSWSGKKWDKDITEQSWVIESREGKEKYFENSTCLYGVLSGTTKYNLPHGRYTYPFAFNIPSNVPSSFEGKFGSIRYELKAEIDIPGGKNLKARRPLIINDIIDTNHPNYQKKLYDKVNVAVGCLCWKAGPLTIKANVDREYYCPGEMILINVRVQNNTNRDMKGLKATLLQEIIYSVQENRKQREVRVIARLDGPPQILKGKSATWSNQPLAIPATQPTIMKSQVIKISYSVKVEVGNHIPCGINPAVKIPVTLGTIPFQARYGTAQHYRLPQEEVSVPDSTEIDIPGGKNLEACRPSLINDIKGTNDPNYQKKPGGEVYKKVGCFCRMTGPVKIEANIDRECYCPGEMILINAQVQNNTNRDMNGLKATLEQTIVYHPKSYERNTSNNTEIHVIASLDGSQQKYGDLVWRNRPLAIPATHPTIHSQFISIDYRIKIEVDVGGFNPSVSMPVKLGTVPFQAYYGTPQHYGFPEDQMPIPDSNFQNTPPMPPAPPNILGYPDMAPPAYAAVVGSKKVDTHAGEDSELFGDALYVPVYTFAQPYKGNIKIKQPETTT